MKILTAVFALLLTFAIDAQPGRRRTPPRVEPAQITAAVRSSLDAAVRPLACGDDSVLSCATTSVNAAITTSDCLLTGSNTYADLHQLDMTPGVPVTVTLTTAAPGFVGMFVQNVSTGDILLQRIGSGTLSFTYTPQDASEVVLTVVFLEAFATGSYSLTVSCGDTPGDCASSPLTSPARVVGSLSDTDCSYDGTVGFFVDSYVVEVREGQTVNVALAAEFDGYVEILEGFGDGTEGGSYVYGRENLDLVYTAAEDGQVTIVVSSVAPQVTGGYVLDMTVSQVLPCKQRSVRK